MILFADTETTGFAKFGRPPNDPDQPKLVQLALLLFDDDGKEVTRFKSVCTPYYDGPIPEKAAAIHGITRERACEVGASLPVLLEVFREAYLKADLTVAHNLDFDALVIEAAFASASSDDLLINRAKTFCTMKSATPITKILQARPRHSEDWKWPKLEECMRHFFNESLEGAHDALVDVEACARVYYALKGLETPDGRAVA